MQGTEWTKAEGQKRVSFWRIQSMSGQLNVGCMRRNYLLFDNSVHLQDFDLSNSSPSRSLEEFLSLIFRQHWICRNEHLSGNTDRTDWISCKMPYYHSNHPWAPAFFAQEVGLCLDHNTWDVSAPELTNWGRALNNSLIMVFQQIQDKCRQLLNPVSFCLLLVH